MTGQNALLSHSRAGMMPCVAQKQAFRVNGLAKKRAVVKSAAKPSETSEAWAAFLLSTSTLVAAAPAIAADAASTTLETIPSPSISTSSIPTPSPVTVDSAVNQIIQAVKTAGGAVKSGIDVASQGVGKVREAADVAAPYVRRGVTAATPYVKATAEAAQDIAKPVIKAAGPVFQSGVKEVEQFLSKQGVNPQSLISGGKEVTSRAEEAINYASPTVKSTASSISMTNPQVLAQYGFIAIGVYYLGPPILKGVFGSLRGFAGQISPAAALDAASNENAIIIDIRTQNEKEYAGIPDLPKRDRLVELQYASVADRKIRGQLRNVDSIEKQMTVLQIAALKKVKKGSRILLMDKNGGVAKDIAKGLNARGYKRVFVVDGGFNGWTSSKLQTRGSSSVSSVEILGPIFGGGTRSTQTKSSRALPSGR